ncbi:hypothetical protein BH683_025500 [Williamsia sp. 1138]|nr:hypothetical protein BH683_025500 [Williamsia sp. 1138]
MLLDAESIGVKASGAHIYGPVNIRVFEGGVTVLAGPGGRGRTALLLTLAGRMKPTSGHLTAFGITDAAGHLFDNAAIAFIDEVDGIEQTIRVRDVVTEQIRWAAAWYKWVRQSGPADLERICRPVFGDLPTPPMDAYVEELPELTAALFRIAVANIHRPPLLVVGGVDRLTRINNSHLLLQRLVALGASQTIVTADINEVSPQHGVRNVIAVHNLTDDEFVGLEPEDRT